VIGKGVELGKDVHIGACTVIEDGAKIGARCVIEAQCFIGAGTEIGEDGHFYPQSVVRENCRIGRRAIVHCGAVIGGDGFGYLVEPRPLMLPKVTKIPQIGVVEIGDDCEIGCNATIDRARFGTTKIGDTVKIDNLVQVGHNVRIGDCAGLIAQSGVAGSTHIGRGVMIWAQAGLSGHLQIGDGSQVGPQAGVTKDVRPGSYVVGSPAMPKKDFAETLLATRSIQRMKQKIADLEARLAALEG
jgi:UDP-3-O-[3-hydroxymyristoyl] glucosamine N-acyltransferase